MVRPPPVQGPGSQAHTKDRWGGQRIYRLLNSPPYLPASEALWHGCQSTWDDDGPTSMSRQLGRNHALGLRGRLGSFNVAALCLAGLGLAWMVASLVPAFRARTAIPLHGLAHLSVTGALPYHVAEVANPAVLVVLNRLRPRGAWNGRVPVGTVLLAPAVSTVRYTRPVLAYLSGHLPAAFAVATIAAFALALATLPALAVSRS